MISRISFIRVPFGLSKQLQVCALCIDRDTGCILHDLKLFEVTQPQYAHPFNSYASLTPAIEAGRACVTFGSCIDTGSFRVLLERRDIECNHFPGIASCVEAKTGEIIWQTRLGGEYSASPVYADGSIWFFREDGKTTVIRPGRTFELLAENRFGDGFLASPAIAGRAWYLCTRTHLYRIEKKSAQR
ncbi:MAG TPA: PQQ-binding-like beta-propeller repeat protein [Blastocatellia bacterium]|nr:PQQ-binding-like beta-propeller repeat protein [Blastocatellia bacterium]